MSLYDVIIPTSETHGEIKLYDAKSWEEFPEFWRNYFTYVIPHDTNYDSVSTRLDEHLYKHYRITRITNSTCCTIMGSQEDLINWILAYA